MRIAIPVWGERVSPVLDTASRLLVVELDGKKEAGRFQVFLDLHEAPGRCFLIQGLNVSVLICGAVSHPFERRLAAAGVTIIHGISGNFEDVLDAYLGGELNAGKFLMPGYGPKGSNCAGRRRGRRPRRQNQKMKRRARGAAKT